MREDGQIAGGQVSHEALAHAQSLVGRTLLGRYRLVELVAMGGIAAVFRARPLGKGQEVAIKILHPDAQNLPELIARFKREAMAGRHIYHPNVAAVHEASQIDDGNWCMVMEFIRGKTLRKVMDEGPLPPLRAARITRQLAAALNAVHDLGIVHRDVKPLNVMVLDGPEEVVKLIDFGLAKVPVEELSIGAESSRNSLTQVGVVMGTIAYIAPEAALGMRAIDRRSDLYALGIMLYEMLAGKHPWDAVTPGEMFAMHKRGLVPPIAERSPGVVVPPSLEAIVRRMLEKEPEARFPNARALLAALDGVIRELEAQLAGTSWLEGWRLVVAALCVGLLAAGAVATWLTLTR